MRKFFIDHNSKTINAIKKINQLGGQSLIVVAKKVKLKGILSSYDLRKAIMNKNILNKDIKKIYNKNPKYVFSDKIKSDFSNIYIKIKKLEILPVLDRKTGKIVDVLTQNKLNKLKSKKLKKINCSIVVMAGGKGTRLKPYTEVLPKPLLPINKKPAIRHILEKFQKHKPKNFFITVNYKAELLKSYFSETKRSYNIQIISEDKPLGTAGSLYYLKNKIKNRFFLTNCDTLIDTDYYELLNFHKKNKNDITAVVANKIFTIPYGVCEIKNNNFSLKEKPKLKFKVNVGLYVIESKILKSIKQKRYLDFNTLLNETLRKGDKVGYYEIKDKDWIDVGQMEKYKSFVNKKV